MDRLYAAHIGLIASMGKYWEYSADFWISMGRSSNNNEFLNAYFKHVLTKVGQVAIIELVHSVSVF